MIGPYLYTSCLIILISLVKVGMSQCPIICDCYNEDRVECSGRNLKNLPEGLSENVIHLDLSNNLFETIPKGLSNLKDLQTLDLSNNLIAYLGQSDFSENVQLRTIQLKNNKFGSWNDFSNNAFETMVNLESLILNHNSFFDLTDNEDRFLISASLRNLSLSNCSIPSLSSVFLNGLPNITTLDLSLNNITLLDKALISDTLEVLDLSNSGIRKIHDVFYDLKSLQKLHLGYNNQLKSFYGRSLSLWFLNATHCALDSLPKGSFTKLRTATFRENHIRSLPARSLSSMEDLQDIDLSHNTIRIVDPEAFYGAKKLRYINLSYNTISSMNARTFNSNFRLTFLILSYNYLKEVIKFDSESLKGLALSHCEISSINRDSLSLMPSLEYLDLSNNLIRSIPDHLQALQLKALDLSLCRISRITNSTFAAMPQLKTISLKGNRLTSDISPSFFFNIIELYLSDNTWRCDCSDSNFKDLYYWLTSGAVATTIYDLVCQSPENVQGFKWGVACYEVWNRRADKAWMYSIIFLFILVFFFCIVVAIKRTLKMRERREHDERQQNIAEARERLQRMREQERESRMGESMNAPDPRELQRPPTYAEALTMPKLSSSQGSLTGSRGSLAGSNSDLKSGQKKRRRRRKKTASAEDVRRPRVTDYSSENEQTYRIYMESDV